MIVHFDLLWNINSPGESIRFLLMKRISSKDVGHSNNNRLLFLYTHLCMFIFTCTDMVFVIEKVNKLELVCLSVFGELGITGEGDFVLSRERKQSMWCQRTDDSFFYIEFGNVLDLLIHS